MVTFKTEPQAPLCTIEKHQIPYYKKYNKDKHYGIKIVFVDIETAIKWAYVTLTSQIVDGAMPYIYNEHMKVKIKYDKLILYNTSRIYNILRPLLIADGVLDKSDTGAIIISADELKKYLTYKMFKVRGLNFMDYKNAKPIRSGGAE